MEEITKIVAEAMNDETKKKLDFIMSEEFTQKIVESVKKSLKKEDFRGAPGPPGPSGPQGPQGPPGNQEPQRNCSSSDTPVFQNQESKEEKIKSKMAEIKNFLGNPPNSSTLLLEYTSKAKNLVYDITGISSDPNLLVEIGFFIMDNLIFFSKTVPKGQTYSDHCGRDILEYTMRFPIFTNREYSILYDYACLKIKHMNAYYCEIIKMNWVDITKIEKNKYEEELNFEKEKFLHPNKSFEDHKKKMEEMSLRIQNIQKENESLGKSNFDLDRVINNIWNKLRKESIRDLNLVGNVMFGTN